MAKRILLWATFALGGLALLGFYLLQPSPPPPRQAFVGANVLTMDERRPRAEAVYIEHDRIVAVGSSREIEALSQPGTQIVDLRGKTLIPGFIDAHGHFPGSGLVTQSLDLNSPPIGKVETIEDAVASLTGRASETPDGDWILAFGFDDTLVREKRHLQRSDLDRASGRHPIAVMHISGHLLSANSRALELASIDRDSEPPDGGVIQKDAEGEPNGVLEETARMGIAEMAMDFSAFQFLEMVDYASAEYARAGVTTAQSGLAAQPIIQGLEFASMLNRIPLRLMLFPDQEVGLKIARGKYDAARFDDDMLQLGAVKLVGDGSIQGFTGYLSAPYHTPFQGDASYRGYPVTSLEELVKLVGELHAAGLQIAIHGNGDASIDDILSAIEEAQRRDPRPDARHIIIHAQMSRPDQLERMRALGVTPSFFQAHTYFWGDRHRDIFIGPERAARISPTASALARGVRFTIHMDTPVVPMDPLLMVWAAVNRLTTSGKPLGLAERITPEQALRAATIDAAWQIFQEDDRGSIEPGKYADLVVLSGDPLADPARIRDLEVEWTLVGGRTVYKRKDL